MPQYRIRIRDDINGREFYEFAEGYSVDDIYAAFTEKKQQRNWTILSIDEIRTTPLSPGCVTAYAVLLGTGAALVAIGGIVYSIALGKEDAVMGGIAFVVFVGLAALYFLWARGLWQQKNWARILVIVSNSVGVLGGLCYVIYLLLLPATLMSYGYQIDQTVLNLAIGLAVLGLAINGYIIYWFASHGEYFK